MVSTAEAVRTWNSVFRTLVEIQAHADAHPDQLAAPLSLQYRLADSADFFSRDPESPVAVWEQLLQKQVGNVEDATALQMPVVGCLVLSVQCL